MSVRKLSTCVLTCGVYAVRLRKSYILDWRVEM